MKNRLAAWADAVALMSSVQASACLVSDSCPAGEHRCSGNAVITCVPKAWNQDGDYPIPTQACGAATCVEVNHAAGVHSAICTTNPTPDPRCDGRDGSRCLDRRTALHCGYLGYGAAAVKCPAICADEPTGQGDCADERDSNAACPSTGGTACDGASVIACDHGHVTTRLDCDADAPLCVRGSASTPHAYCAQSTACATEDRAECDVRGRVHGCIAGHLVYADCPLNTICHQRETTPGVFLAECDP